MPQTAPGLTCMMFIGVLASQKKGASEKALRETMQSMFPRHCECLSAKTKNPLQIRYGRITKQLSSFTPVERADFLAAFNEQTWQSQAERQSLHDYDCTLGCNHDSFVKLWGQSNPNQAKRRVYVQRCDALREQCLHEHAPGLDLLEASSVSDSIPQLNKAPYKRWVREAQVARSLNDFKRKFTQFSKYALLLMSRLRLMQHL